MRSVFRFLMNAKNISRMIVILFVIIFAFSFPLPVYAQNEPAKASKAYKLPSNLKKHLMDKYQVRDVVSNLQETPYGPKGSLHIMANIAFQNIIEEPGMHGRARAIAKKFLKDEAELLGLPDLNELRENRINVSKGYGGEYTDIYYLRYVNKLQFEDVSVHITIGPDESITAVSANLKPAPPEVYEATKRNRLSKNEVIKIIEREIQSQGADPKEMRILEIGEFASSLPPYAVWTVDVNLKRGTGRWNYSINAFTGEILHKVDAIIIN